MGYDAEGHPAPLIDQVHRLMHLWKTGDVAKVDDYLDSRGLRKNALFLYLLQALIELSRRDEQRDEVVILENLSNHLQARGVAPTRSVTLPGFGDDDQNETGSEVKRPLTPRELRTVIESIRLKRFKNFQDATLKLGPLTILIGANAAGKSNLRDAFLFLHGIGRGYTLAEIFGEKYVGGERVWGGTRGGVREVAYLGSDSFELSAELRLPPERKELPPIEYRVDVSVAEAAAKAPRVVHESLDYPLVFGKSIQVKGRTGFRTSGQEVSREANLDISFSPERSARRKSSRTYPPTKPVLYQVTEDDEGNGREARALSRFVLHELRGFRFLDLSPAQMRIPSQPGQTVLGDQGENLSSVLSAIIADDSRKEVLLEWVAQADPDGRC